MEVKLHINEYSAETGIRLEWEDNFHIATEISGDEIVITANKAGLISLAKHLLTLAQDDIQSGNHFHLDEYGGLESGSKELIIARI
jgi:hypothetical protein